jgi:hypothetical protein
MAEFMREVLDVVAIIVAGLMVGSELAIAAFARRPTCKDVRSHKAANFRQRAILVDDPQFVG